MKNKLRVKNEELRVKNKVTTPVFFLFFILNSSLFISSCGVYSFTGTTLSPAIKTVTVNNFTLATAGGPANLPLTFNERLKEYYQRYTNLRLFPTMVIWFWKETLRATICWPLPQPLRIRRASTGSKSPFWPVFITTKTKQRILNNPFPSTRIFRRVKP